VRVRQLAREREILVIGRDEPRRRQHRLDDNRRYVAAEPLHRLLELADVVQLDDVEERGHGGRNPELVRVDARRLLPESVVGAARLHDRRPPSRRPGDADGDHRRLRSGAREPDPLEAESLADVLRVLREERCRPSEVRSLGRLPGDRLDDERRGMPVHERRKAVPEVDELIPVDVEEARSAAARERERVRRVVDHDRRRRAGQQPVEPIDEPVRAAALEAVVDLAAPHDQRQYRAVANTSNRGGGSRRDPDVRRSLEAAPTLAESRRLARRRRHFGAATRLRV
jgi:hypothetical protein